MQTMKMKKIACANIYLLLQGRGGSQCEKLLRQLGSAPTLVAGWGQGRGGGSSSGGEGV